MKDLILEPNNLWHLSVRKLLMHNMWLPIETYCCRHLKKKKKEALNSMWADSGWNDVLENITAKTINSSIAGKNTALLFLMQSLTIVVRSAEKALETLLSLPSASSWLGQTTLCIITQIRKVNMHWDAVMQCAHATMAAGRGDSPVSLSKLDFYWFLMLPPVVSSHWAEAD